MAVLIQDYWLDVLNYSVHSKANFVLVDHGFEVLDVLVQEVEDNDRILVIDNAVWTDNEKVEVEVQDENVITDYEAEVVVYAVDDDRIVEVNEEAGVLEEAIIDTTKETGIDEVTFVVDDDRRKVLADYVEVFLNKDTVCLR